MHAEADRRPKSAEKPRDLLLGKAIGLAAALLVVLVPALGLAIVGIVVLAPSGQVLDELARGGLMAPTFHPPVGP